MTRIRPAFIASRSMVIAAILLGIATTASAMSQRSGVSDPGSNGKALQQPSSPVQREADNTVGPVYSIGGSVQPPIVFYAPDPQFSEQARNSKFSGGVIVSLIVDRDGRPRDVHVLRGVGMGLDEEAVKTVQQYRFKPATRNDEPVAVKINVRINFQYSD